ncbi:Uroporphyrinogen decarboxylase [Ochromonadaceae sp. CCMP2298]|nr:Uroporphyrinogen decarboxylase [Ochromonadaceae sp. CCMP2298]
MARGNAGVIALLGLVVLACGFNFNSQAFRTARAPTLSMAGDADILVRAYRGEEVERTPVWLMRQAGRYMADFRVYSEKYPFRQRSETPEIAIELSLQPWRTFGVDGVIMFSDILTPLPALGIDFTIVPGKGPKIINPVKCQADIDALQAMVDVDAQVPFLGPILKSLRKETEGRTSLIGFIGAPWTLAAYSVEGGHSKLCATFKKMCYEEPAMAHSFLDKLADNLCVYASFQVQSGAQVLQIFESWAHHMPEELWAAFAKPYANKVAKYLKEKHPDVPVVYFANGGSGYLHRQVDMDVDGLSLDWKVSMAQARKVAPHTVLAGNVDPITLYGSEANIRKAVASCIQQAGGKHVLNLGHGVEKDTSESAVQAFVTAAREVSQINA